MIRHLAESTGGMSTPLTATTPQYICMTTQIAITLEESTAPSAVTASSPLDLWNLHTTPS